MADNVTFTLNADSTPPNGTVAATDELADGSHAGITKLAYSADGVRTFVQADADGLLVNLGANNDVTVTGTVSVTEPVSVDDNGGSLTVDAPLATPVHTRISDGTDVVNVSAAGGLQVDGSGVTQPVSAVALPLPAGAATSALQLPDGHNVTVDNGAGAAAVNIQDGGNVITVDGTVSVTEPVSVDDNGGSLTVDAPLATPVHTRISDGTDAVNVSAAGALIVDGSAVTQPVSGTVSVTEPVSVDDNGGSLTVDAPLATPAHVRISDGTDVTNVSAAGALIVDGSAVTQPVSGTVTANQGTGAALETAWRMIGFDQADDPVSVSPVTIGGRASTALPSPVSADGDIVHNWLNRNGAIVVASPPHVGLNSDPYNQQHAGVEQTTTQTSAVLVAGGASEKLVVMDMQLQVFGTNAGDFILYFGTGAYARGTNRAIFDGTFLPSATLAPGAIRKGPFISGTNGDDILITTTNNLNFTVSVWYYIVL